MLPAYLPKNIKKNSLSIKFNFKDFTLLFNTCMLLSCLKHVTNIVCKKSIKKNPHLPNPTRHSSATSNKEYIYVKGGWPSMSLPLEQILQNLFLSE